jgi:uncharacterized protein with GYD domain
MPTYVVLYKWTEQGIRNVKDSPARAEASIKAAEAVGVKMTGLWYTVGEYDMVAVVETANEQAVIGGILMQGAQGFVRTTTLPARTPAEFKEIVTMIP